jgi:hypothetical protein
VLSCEEDAGTLEKGFVDLSLCHGFLLNTVGGEVLMVCSLLVSLCRVTSPSAQVGSLSALTQLLFGTEGQMIA